MNHLIKPDRTVQLLHTSDLHIDSLESCESLATTVKTANDLDVDLFIVAGDLFDNSRVTSGTIEKAIDTLNQLRMPAVLLPGNHDQMDSQSVYHRVELSLLAPSLHLITSLDGEQKVIPELGMAVWGRAMKEHSPSFRPLLGAPPKNGPGWYIGVAHGYYFAEGATINRSSPILPKEIAATNYDYVALGHVHVFRDVSTNGVRSAYSGAPDHAHDSPTNGFAALVELHPEKGVYLRKIALAR